MATSEARIRMVAGRYRLDHPIGSGGMGTVWHGIDEMLGREVAVKEVRFPPAIEESEQAVLRERTLREARATARLNHPNIVTTYDVVEEDGRPYIVMELLRARSLSAVLREDGPLPPQRVARIGLALLGALETSHDHGVVHRDVKPGNVLMTEQGRAVLTDFGIATTAGDPALTSTGVVLGSPAYMAPERARGRKPGAESDLWSLGATLYAAVEGRPPHDCESALGTLTAIISDPVEPPSAGGPLSEAVLGLLEKDPLRRMDIATARGLLESAAADPTTAAVAPAAGVIESDPRAYDGHHPPRRLLVAALAVALLVIGGVVALALAQGPDAPVADRGTQPKAAPKSSPAGSTPESTPPGTPSGPPPDGTPAGYTVHTDISGFSVTVPVGWVAERSSPTAVDITDPDGTRFLRIDQTDNPGDDPEKDWERQEKSVEKRLDGYELIDITEVDYNGWPAADWEFTIGADTHVLNRGFVPNEDKGYALYLSSSEEQWGESLQIFQTAADSFVPAGG